jgi:hypothetical protein
VSREAAARPGQGHIRNVWTGVADGDVRRIRRSDRDHLDEPLVRHAESGSRWNSFAWSSPGQPLAWRSVKRLNEPCATGNCVGLGVSRTGTTRDDVPGFRGRLHGTISRRSGNHGCSSCAPPWRISASASPGMYSLTNHDFLTTCRDTSRSGGALSCADSNHPRTCTARVDLQLLELILLSSVRYP